ncbi:MAG TPA: SpoIIE family protein phosphatase [Candidatus Polarisedimenticolia bacterium]|nr:SpoIIE family protein phosphatase [Candidatus Polarisedimenticolia bacterium]
MKIEKPEWLLQMENILETLNEGVLISDERHRILFINSRMSEMLGIPPEEVAGQEGDYFYSPDEYKFVLAQIERRERTGRYRVEFVVPQKDGSRLPVITSSRTFKDPDGHQFAVVTFTDISEQKRAEARLRDANTRLEERQREIDEDLALAARVQQSIAPQPLAWGGMRVDTYYHPVRTIGGDFGLVKSLDGEYLHLIVCDVSGHGIGSALVANRLYTEILAQLRSGTPLEEMLRQLNRFVMQSIGGSLVYFTIAAASLDRGGRRMTFAAGGHPPAMIVTPGEEPRLLESRSTVLGALPDPVPPDPVLDVELRPGDRVVLYTDGITDVFDSRGEMLGVSGVQKFVRETSLLPLGEMKQGILDRVAAWREGPPTDDVSLVLLEVL